MGSRGAEEKGKEQKRAIQMQRPRRWAWIHGKSRCGERDLEYRWGQGPKTELGQSGMLRLERCPRALAGVGIEPAPDQTPTEAIFGGRRLFPKRGPVAFYDSAAFV